MSYTFPQSTAVSSISDIENGKVEITWKTGKSYTYIIEDVADYTQLLTETVNSNSSIGSFVNSQIQQNKLSLINV